MTKSEKYEFMGIATMFAMNGIVSGRHETHDNQTNEQIGKEAVAIAEQTMNAFEERMQEMGLDED